MDIQIDSSTVGVALVVSNDYKTLGGKMKLNSTHIDSDNIEQVFKEFGYVVYKMRNVTKKKFVSCYKSLAECKYLPTCKRLLLYFAGHGDNGRLLMQDDKEVQIEDMIVCFKPDVANNEALARMVKMFFFDACRGGRTDHGYRVRATPHEITCLRRVPNEGNSLLVYSSTRHYGAFETSAGGRWTNCLCRVLRESKENDGVLSILTKPIK